MHCKKFIFVVIFVAMKSLNNEIYCDNLVKEFGFSLLFATDNQRNSKQVLLDAIKSDYRCFVNFEEQMKDNLDFVLECLKANPKTILFCERWLQENNSIELAAQVCPQIYLYLSDSSKQNIRIILKCIELDASIILFVPQNIKTASFLALAVERNGAVMNYINSGNSY